LQRFIALLLYPLSYFITFKVIPLNLHDAIKFEPLDSKSFRIFEKACEGCECMHYSLFEFLPPSFLLVNTFSKFLQNSFEKRQVDACCFKSVCVNLA
jgi:hypothetical protein